MVQYSTEDWFQIYNNSSDGYSGFNDDSIMQIYSYGYNTIKLNRVINDYRRCKMVDFHINQMEKRPNRRVLTTVNGVKKVVPKDTNNSTYAEMPMRQVEYLNNCRCRLNKKKQETIDANFKNCSRQSK